MVIVYWYSLIFVDIHWEIDRYIYIYILWYSWIFINIFTDIIILSHMITYDHIISYHVPSSESYPIIFASSLAARIHSWSLSGNLSPNWSSWVGPAMGISYRDELGFQGKHRKQSWKTGKNNGFPRKMICKLQMTKPSPFFPKLRNFVAGEHIWKVVSFLLSASWMQDFSASMFFDWNYPLVICCIAIENDHRNSGFSHW